MQAIANLRLLQLAQISIEPLQQGLAFGVVGRPLEAEFFMQLFLQHALQDVGTQQLGAARVECERFVVLVHLALQLLQRAVGLGARHRRHQVVDDHGLRAPLGLAAFAGVIDDEGVQVRQRAEDGVGPAGRAQRHALAGQPFEVAVLAHMHHRIDGEGAAQPEVEREVVVRRHEIGVVVGRDQIDVAAACRLDANEHVAQAQARDHEALAAQHRVLFGCAPQGVDRRLAFSRQALEVLQVVGQRQALTCGTRGVGVEVVGDAAHEFGDQGIAALGQCTGGVAGVAQRLQDDHGGGGRVQPHAVGQACVVVRVVGKDQRDAFAGVRLAAQHAPAPRQIGHEGDAFGLGLVVHHVDLGALAAPRQALEADGAADDAAIDFGHHHLHRQVARRQAVRIGQPLLVRAAGGDELQHRGVTRQGAGRFLCAVE